MNSDSNDYIQTTLYPHNILSTRRQTFPGASLCLCNKVYRRQKGQIQLTAYFRIPQSASYETIKSKDDSITKYPSHMERAELAHGEHIVTIGWVTEEIRRRLYFRQVNASYYCLSLDGIWLLTISRLWTCLTTVPLSLSGESYCVDILTNPLHK
jgi:hypothetical protein